MARKIQPVSINDVEFDALIDDGRELPNSVPSYPVEEGFSISDTIIHNPQTLSITVFLTEATVDYRNRGHGGAGWVDKVIKQLEDLYFSSVPCTVPCTVKTPDAYYLDMAILNISILPMEGNGYAKKVTVNFQKVETVNSRKTTIPASYGKSGDTGGNVGTASTSVSSTPQGNAAGNATDSSNDSHASTAYKVGNASGILPNLLKGLGGS